MPRPTTSFAPNTPPTPASAHCPSDICPAHPVSTVAETATTEKSSTVARKNVAESRSGNGSTITTAAPMPTASSVSMPPRRVPSDLDRQRAHRLGHLPRRLLGRRRPRDDASRRVEQRREDHAEQDEVGEAAASRPEEDQLVERAEREAVPERECRPTPCARPSPRRARASAAGARRTSAGEYPMIGASRIPPTPDSTPGDHPRHRRHAQARGSRAAARAACSAPPRAARSRTRCSAGTGTTASASIGPTMSASTCSGPRTTRPNSTGSKWNGSGKMFARPARGPRRRRRRLRQDQPQDDDQLPDTDRRDQHDQPRAA